MRIELSCSACGGNRFGFPHDAQDDSVVVCEECGHNVGTLGALKDRVVGALTSRSLPPLERDN